MEVRLSTPVAELAGVGVKRGRLFEKLGVRTVSDLVRHLPHRYEHEHAEGAIGDLPMNAISSARGTIVGCRVVAGRTKPRFEATLQDHRDRLHLVWFNATFLRHQIHPGLRIRVQGKTQAFGGYPQMVNPKWEALREDEEGSPMRGERIRPIYPATDALPSQAIERVAAATLPLVRGQLVDPLPETLVRARAMPTLERAYVMAHLPEDEDQPKQARRRLAYNELLLLQLGVAIKRRFNESMLQAPALRWSDAIDEHIRARFPFKLTEAQDAVVKEIVHDLGLAQPMNRLVQGDVGAGKTVVALYALLLAAANRKQGALMAPTELLAEQHYSSIRAMLEGSNVRLALLTGSLRPQARAELVARLAKGEIDIVIATQALLTEVASFKDLAVVVIDEQHRFGVLQRAVIRRHGEADSDQTLEATRDPVRALEPGASAEDGAAGRRSSPHYLVMTATPIPRSLGLTVFGDLDISTITALPPGRTPIATRVVPPEDSEKVYTYIAKRVAGGEQAYVVVPSIDPTGGDAPTPRRNVTEHVKLLEEKYFTGRRVAAVHGRLEAAERDEVMRRFRAGEIDALVATTVIEVGVDVPNATLMVVEHAERFGLAQLHQLRGRIGRGDHGRKSLCVYIAEATTPEAQERMKAIAATRDGFKIAEADFQIRGMGEFFGTRQHGRPPLRVAKIPEDMELLQLAQRDAQAIVSEDPALSAPQRERLRTVLVQHYGETLGLIDVG